MNNSMYVYFCEINDNIITRSVDKGYAQIGENLSLRDDYLGLYGSAENVQLGYTAFINEYIQGEMTVGNITGEEEARINAVLDEIIGGE
jgi:hypothetical protein